MALNTLDLIVDENSDYTLNVQYLDPTGIPIDISTASIKAQIVDNFSDENILGVFDVMMTVPTSGMFTLTLPALVTSTFSATNTVNASQRVGLVGQYDVAISQNNLTTYLIEGAVRVSRKATE